MIKEEVFVDCDEVGQIIGGVLKNTAKGVFWNFDESVAIILRDLLRQYAEEEKKNALLGIPVWVADNDDVDVNNLAEDEIAMLHEKWTGIILSIADDLDNYVRPERDADNNEAFNSLGRAFVVLAKWLPYMWL